jgi:pSer/pThr/pTyr-binding forkhead associated (FHA) protein
LGLTSYGFTIVEGPDADRALTLRVGKTYLGRLEISDDEVNSIFCWALNDKTVSRTHAEISLAESEMPILRHISDTNATFVDGRSVLKEHLKPGHIIKIGQTSIRMESPEQGIGSE